MTTSAKLNEFNHAEDPARQLLERLGWTYVPREALAAERSDEREVLLKGRLRAALMRLNEWMTEEQAERAIFELEHVDSTGMARNQAVHEYLTYGMPLTWTGRGAGTRAPSASSTSTTRRAASTSSSSPRSSAYGEATSEAALTTTSAWSSPILCCSSTASPWW